MSTLAVNRQEGIAVCETPTVHHTGSAKNPNLLTECLQMTPHSRHSVYNLSTEEGAEAQRSDIAQCCTASKREVRIQAGSAVSLTPSPKENPCRGLCLGPPLPFASLRSISASWGERNRKVLCLSRKISRAERWPVRQLRRGLVV